MARKTSSARRKRLPAPRPALSQHSDKHASLVEAVYESLLEAIVSGRLASGATVSELSLSKDLEVSRTPVHDALRQLAKDGLVEQILGHRPRIAVFTADDIFEIFELRKILEGHAAELAAGRMDSRQIGPLRAAADALAGSVGAVDWTVRWADHDELFHRTIAESTGNRRLAQDINRYRLLHRSVNRLHTDAESLRSALDEHMLILDALTAGDRTRAKQAMTDHISVWQEYFFRNFPAK